MFRKKRVQDAEQEHKTHWTIRCHCDEELRTDRLELVFEFIETHQ